MSADLAPSFSRVRVLCVRDGRLLLVQHQWIDGSYFWFIPGGGIKTGESIEDAAVREVWEEAGVKIRVVRRLTRPAGLTGVGPEHVFVLAEPLDEKTRGPQPAVDGDKVFAVEWHAITDDRPIGGLTAEYWGSLGGLLRELVREGPQPRL